MVDNSGISPISNFFNTDNTSANKMSEEKQGQGGEYFAQELEDESTQQNQTNPFQDRSAQLQASLDSLALVNVSSIHFNKLKKKEENKKVEAIGKDKEEADD